MIISITHLRIPIVFVESISKPLVYPQRYFSDRDNVIHHRLSQNFDNIRMLKTYLPRGHRKTNTLASNFQ